MNDQEQDAAPRAGRRKGFGWGELLGGIVLALSPVAGTLAYDSLTRPSGEVAAAAEMLALTAPHIDAYRRQSDLFDVNSRRVANAMLRGGSQEAAQARYDDFTLVWSDYQTTYSDLKDMILPRDNTAAPELRDLVSYMDGAMAASNRIDLCLQSALVSYDAGAPEQMAARARTRTGIDEAAVGAEQAARAQDQELRCLSGDEYFVVGERMQRLGGCNYALRKAMMGSVADLRRTRDDGPVARLADRLGGRAAPATGGRPQNWGPLLDRVKAECARARLRPSRGDAPPASRLNIWQRVDAAAPAPVPATPPV
ncbi:hypothetical protein [Brevundimonas sp.]|uniref:hypothetical protein n=1 Tax=Brevundimonas sp. TaxID=1871086 RepID=UPI00121F0E4C|nr:hypothetical protein [Brevundimonas sp.]TAJ60150.1 MAG: hypothetical protein EPO49_09485 [Brevundimonas sp.]